MAYAKGSEIGGRRTIRIDVDSISTPFNRYKIVHYKRPARKSVGLALSGGGSRGLSQVGVLKAFEEKQIPIDFIVGTSIGSIVGGLYSAGYSGHDLEKLCKTLPWNDITSFSSTTRRRDLFLEQKRVRDRASVTLQFDGLKLIVPKSLSTAQQLTKTLDLLVLNALYHPNSDFNSLAIPFRAVATDLMTGKRVVLENQSLSEAMRASATIPLIFSPIKKGQYELVDGGLVSNLPTDILDEEHVELKVAVNAMGAINHSYQDLNLPWKAADQVIGILMQEQNEDRLSRADLVITPELGNRESSDFSSIDSLISQGYESGKALADSLKNLIPVKQTDDIEVTGYEKSLSGAEGLSDSLSARMLGIIKSGTHAKATLATLLETDHFSDAYGELDATGHVITYHVKPLPKFNAMMFSGSKGLNG
ncbi:MAG: patatin-like phospholipase family protein, partial [Chlorobiales bacterium]|nr:patatin-like phospholipase family protein [Chlorobiales bacterium]